MVIKKCYTIGVVDKRADNLYACVWFSFVQNNILWSGPLYNTVGPLTC